MITMETDLSAVGVGCLVIDASASIYFFFVQLLQQVLTGETAAKDFHLCFKATTLKMTLTRMTIWQGDIVDFFSFFCPFDVVFIDVINFNQFNVNINLHLLNLV